MKKNINSYEKYIESAIKAIKDKNYELAEGEIKEAMIINPHLPEAHNLYGILEEKIKDFGLAKKHYRAACALDPAYMPSIHNLERVTAFYYHNCGIEVDYGDHLESNKSKSQYKIVYDYHHVGHLFKQER
ncbi:MAG: hypothetical protein ACM3X7_11720 [Solirubrobacterales bacterium]